MTEAARVGADVRSNPFWVGLVPLLVSLPFLFGEPEAFLRSILFAAPRLPRSHFGAPSIDEVAGQTSAESP